MLILAAHPAALTRRLGSFKPRRPQTCFFYLREDGHNEAVPAGYSMAAGTYERAAFSLRPPFFEALIDIGQLSISTFRMGQVLASRFLSTFARDQSKVL